MAENYSVHNCKKCTVDRRKIKFKLAFSTHLSVDFYRASAH